MLAALTVGGVAVAHADTFPVAGNVSGSFATTQSGGTITTTTTTNDTWKFVNGVNSTTVVYSAGPSFGVTNVPPNLDISLGSLSMTVAGNGGIGNGTETDNLNISVNFSTPSGTASFTDLLSLQVVNGSNGYRILFSDLPGPETFTVDGVDYTVTFDGMFDLETGGNNITETGLRVDNGGNAAAGYLRGTISAEGSIPPSSVVPEPGSVSLLLTAFGGVALSLYRKRLV